MDHTIQEGGPDGQGAQIPPYDIDDLVRARARLVVGRAAVSKDLDVGQLREPKTLSYVHAIRPILAYLHLRTRGERQHA